MSPEPVMRIDCPACEKTGKVRQGVCVVCAGTGELGPSTNRDSPTHLRERIEMLERRLNAVAPERSVLPPPVEGWVS